MRWRELEQMRGFPKQLNLADEFRRHRQQQGFVLRPIENMGVKRIAPLRESSPLGTREEKRA